MLHLTVDALEAAVAAELPTAHISHLQQARWSHTGGPWSFYWKRLDSPSQIWISTLLQDSSMHVHLLSAGRAALPRPIGSVWALTPGGCTDYEDYFSLFLSEPEPRLSVSLGGELMVLLFGGVLAVWRASWWNSKWSSPRSFLETLQNETGEVAGVGRPVRGESEGWRWRDGAFGRAARMGFDAGGRGETRTARAPPAASSRKFPTEPFSFHTDFTF